MRRILNLVLIVQLSAGAWWTLAAAGTPGRGDMGLLGILVVVYAVQAAAVLIALWALWRHESERRRALWILALPIVFWFAPGIVKSLAGGHLSSDELIVVLATIAALVVAACFAAPRSAAAVLPQFLVTSRMFNGIVLASLIVGWLLLGGLVALLVVGRPSATGDATGYGLAYAIVLLVVVLTSFGAASLVAAAWAWVGLRGGVDGACRRLNVAQLVVSVPGVLFGAGAVAFVAGQG